jgi:TM2 domain-containing membrane protein YozV
MAERYPALKDNLLSAKAAMDSRPRLKKKPPAVAGVLSALVPGAGQIYAGKVSDGLMLLLAEGIQVGCAAYLLNGVDVERERSEMVLGVTLSLTSVATYIGSIKNAVSKTEEYNTGLAQKEIEIFADSLRTAPPGYLR